MKRTFDLIVSFILLICLSPLILIVALAVKIKLGTPILFKQQRPGLYGKPFNLYKFRTMTAEKDQYGKFLPDYIRLTAFGKLMRKYSLDELPQLFNVLKGDISLVGPRPLLMEYLALYTEEQSRRHHVKPGITGWAQINGRNAISWEEKFKLDVWYVDHHSFLLDLKIMFFTIVKVVKTEGINQPGEATIESFKGNSQLSRGGHG
jgi:sugar transferase EpsL